MQQIDKFIDKKALILLNAFMSDPNPEQKPIMDSSRNFTANLIQFAKTGTKFRWTLQSKMPYNNSGPDTAGADGAINTTYTV